MNKYEKQFKVVEKYPNKVNKLKLDLLFLNFKMNYMEGNIYEKFKKLNSNICLVMIMNLFWEQSLETKQYLKNNIIDNLDQPMLYKKYIRNICNNLLLKNYNDVENLLKSFVEMELVKDVNLLKKNERDFIDITLKNKKKVRFSHIPLDIDLIDAYRGHCHEVTSCFLKDYPNQRQAGIFLENNELFGKHYHSVIIIDDEVFDLAHNILMKYEDYLNLFKPEVLVYDSGKNILEEMKQLEMDKDYMNCKYIDLLKYGISKQLENNKKLIKSK